MVRAIKSSTTATLILLSCLSLSLGACSVIHGLVAHGTVGIRQQDLEDLRSGKLLAVRERYEDRQKTRQPELTNRELALLCDIYVKHVSISEARACLDKLEEKTAGDAKIADAINGKRALIDYLLGEYEQAAARSKDLTSDGGRYVYALSMVQLGKNQPADKLAKEWMLSYQPPQVFLAANLFLATKDYDKVLETLQDPERRLDRDYNLSGSTDIFGLHINPATLRVDLFGEFGFGLLDTYSYAPRSNIYVEYTLAKAELAIGQIPEARKRYDTILAFKWLGAYRDIEWRALSDRAQISERDGDTDNAIKRYKQSVDVIESARASITTDAGRIGFVGDKQEVYGNLVRLLLDRGDDDAAGKAFEYSERARSRALVDLLASVREFGAQSVSQQESDTVAIRRAEQAAIEQSELQDVADPKDVEVQLLQSRYIIDKYRTDLAESIRYQVSVLVNVSRTEAVKLRSLLQPNEGLLCYFYDNDAWSLFLVTQKKLYPVKLEIKNLEEKVKGFLAKLSNKEDYKELAKELYVQLIQIAENQLPENELPEKLTIVPYGVLFYLPFAALMRPDDKYLIQRHTLTMLPSAALREFIIPDPISFRILAIGNPSREDVQNLRFAEQEARMAASMDPRPEGGDLLIKGRATKKQLMTDAPNHGIIHIASHGKFQPMPALGSRLLLAPDAATGDLTAADLFTFMGPRWGAQIVLLSACESTLVKVNPGQDIIGLQRGFFYAGTDSIIGTLWPIDDQATLSLMMRFYEYLKRGSSGAKALRLAQQYSISQKLHPKDWAAFTFTGLNLEPEKELYPSSLPKAGRPVRTDKPLRGK